MTTRQPLTTKQKRIDEALDILRQLGMPNEQLNNRTAICLLALLDLPEATPWNKASNPMLGIRAILDFAREKLGHNYAENTRESIRKYSVKQLVAAGILLHNPDKPAQTTAIKLNPTPSPCSVNLAQEAGKMPCSPTWKHANRWQTNSPGTATCNEFR